MDQFFFENFLFRIRNINCISLEYNIPFRYRMLVVGFMFAMFSKKIPVDMLSKFKETFVLSCVSDQGRFHDMLISKTEYVSSGSHFEKFLVAIRSNYGRNFSSKYYHFALNRSHLHKPKIE